MKTLLTLTALLASCGEGIIGGDDPTNPQDENKCLSCGAVFPEEPPVPETEGYIKAQPEALSFFCVADIDPCDSVQPVSIYNLTFTPVAIYQPIIKNAILNEDTAFSIVSETEYPVILARGESTKIDISFDWTTKTQVGFLLVQVGAETITVELVGKLFIL
jgi:hypothetical protein